MRSQSFFTTLEQRARTDAPEIRLRCEARVDMVVRAVLCATTVLLFVGHSAILPFVSNNPVREMVWLSGFTALFAALLNVSTKGKRHDIMAATAIDCAVLVVFLSDAAPRVASSAQLSRLNCPA